MSEKQAKEAILDIGQRMYVRNFVAANDGNISKKTGDNEIWATPTGVSKGFMKKKMLVKVDLEGNILEGTYKPSSELNVPVAPYAELGSKEVPEVIAPYCHTHNGVLLANHGAVTWAEDAYAAYYRLESMEYYANILLITGKILGKQNEFTKEQIERLLAMREKFGIKRGGTPHPKQ